MKDYNNPTVWADFLQKNHVESDAPPPPPDFLLGVTRDDREVKLVAWARGADPDRRRARRHRIATAHHSVIS